MLLMILFVIVLRLYIYMYLYVFVLYFDILRIMKFINLLGIVYQIR